MNLYQKRMLERYEQAECYSEAEYHRRILLTRKVMQEYGADLLIIFAPYREAYDQWLTGKRLLEYIIIPKDGKIKAITSNRISKYGEQKQDILYSSYFVQKRVIPVHEEVEFSESLSIEEVVKLIRQSEKKTIAVVHKDALEARLFEDIEEALDGVEMVDITLPLDMEKNVKSAEEREVISIAARAHEKVMLAMPYIIRQGKTDREITNEISYMMCTQGSGGNIIHAFLINYGRSDQPAYEMATYHAPGYTFKKGDRVMVLLETNGYGGHMTALGRFFSLGEPDPEFAQYIDMTVKTQQYATSLLRPDMTVAEIAKRTKTFVEENGYETNQQCFIHGLGGFIYEQPAINDISENSKLKEGMFVHAHPVIKRRFPFTDKVDYQFILDTFYVSEKGGVRTDTVEQKLFIIE